MIEKTHAIVLKFIPWSNSSRIVTWLTREHGKITTMIKGSQRPKSLFLGQYDLFYTCEMLYYPRRADELKIARECYPLKRRTLFRTDWKAAASASYLCDLINRISIPEIPNPDLYDFLDFSLDDLAERGADDAYIFWCELKLLKLQGLEPRLNQCIQCGAMLDAGTPGKWFSYVRGGILCRSCGAHAAESTTRIPPDVLATLSSWQHSISVNCRTEHLVVRTAEGDLERCHEESVARTSGGIRVVDSAAWAP
ncbi:MAG: DNA repair protein RecO, partial [Verrucomicrobiota bacterium]